MAALSEHSTAVAVPHCQKGGAARALGSSFPATSPRWADLAQSVRALGSQWLQEQQQPHAELLAVVWGPVLDRAHARQLLAQAHEPVNEQALEQAAQHFNAMPPLRQQRLRRWLLRQHQRWDNVRDTLH